MAHSDHIDELVDWQLAKTPGGFAQFQPMIGVKDDRSYAAVARWNPEIGWYDTHAD